MSRGFTCIVLSCGALAAGLLMAAGASAAFPGTNGKIAFVNWTGAPGSSLDIVAFDATGQNRVQLTNSPEDDAFPSYSADGERIVFSRGAVGDLGEGQIWVMSQDGTGQTQLTNPPVGTEDHDPAFSPDGTRIVFTHEDNTGNQIWIMNADGSGQTQLTFAGPSADRGSGPVFSPNGQRIVFVHFNGAVGYHDIAMMNPDGSGQTNLTTPSASTDDYQPDFSPNGQRVVFDRYNQTQDDLFVMNADGSGQTALTDSTSDLDLSPAFAPDGTKVAFERDDAGFTVANITLVDSAGLNQNITPLTSNAPPVQDFEPGWQPLNPPSCNLSGKKTSKSVKRLRFTITCENENATVTARGNGKAPKAPKAVLASKATKFKIPAVTVHTSVGAPTKIKLKVSKKGQKALKEAAKAGKKAKAKITATATDDLGQTSKDSLKVQFKAKKKAALLPVPSQPRRRKPVAALVAPRM